MKNDKRMILSIIWVVLGAALVGCSLFELVDSFWAGMGGAMLAIGVLQTARWMRCHSDETYRESREVAEHDERNRYIRSKAWAWAGYLFIMIAGVGCILFRVAGMEQASTFAGGSVCLLMVLWWVCYWVISRKN